MRRAGAACGGARPRHARARGAQCAKGGAYRIGARLRQPVARTGATPAGDKTRRGQRACACAIKKPNAPLSSAKSYCLNPAHRRQGMRKLCLEHFAPLKHGACTMGTPPIWHRRAHSPMRPVLQYMGGGGGVKVRARRGAWRTLGAVHAHGVADGGGEGTCFSPDGAARPQTAGTALEACGGQGGGGLQM